MIENKQHTLKDDTPLEKTSIKLKPIKELKDLNFEQSDAFVCDMETGICGPVNQAKEIK